MPPPISIVIAAKNEAGKIEHALRSARACSWCTELAVFDTGSTDGTKQIARQHAHRVESLEWTSYADSKRRMSEQATHDWVFILDADEEITPELAAEIAALPDEAFASHPVLTMPRRNYLLGRHVRAWDPDRQNRLFHRGRVRWPERAVHDKRIAADGSPRALRHAILHNRHSEDFGDYFDGPRYAARTEALAREMYEAGKRVSALGLAVRPPAALFKYLILKGGIFQGAFGILVAQKAAVSTQLKYARLWDLQQQGTKGRRDGGTK